MRPHTSSLSLSVLLFRVFARCAVARSISALTPPNTVTRQKPRWGEGVEHILTSQLKILYIYYSAERGRDYCAARHTQTHVHRRSLASSQRAKRMLIFLRRVPHARAITITMQGNASTSVSAIRALLCSYRRADVADLFYTPLR